MNSSVSLGDGCIFYHMVCMLMHTCLHMFMRVLCDLLWGYMFAYCACRFMPARSLLTSGCRRE